MAVPVSWLRSRLLAAGLIAGLGALALGLCDRSTAAPSRDVAAAPPCCACDDRDDGRVHRYDDARMRDYVLDGDYVRRRDEPTPRPASPATSRAIRVEAVTADYTH